MLAFLPSLAIGIICIFLGISNTRGNISSLHLYHRHRVTEEDRLPFGKKVGLGTIIIGAAIIIFSIMSVLSACMGIDVFMFVGIAVLAAGLITGLVMTFHAMIKYNKGIF